MRYILKLDPPEHPLIVANEEYFLELSRAAGIPTVESIVVRDIDDRPGLLIRRFDRVPRGDGATMSLECEDACQLLDRWPADKYNVSTESALAALADACPARPVAVRDVVRQLAFAWLTANGDVHAKNLSVLTGSDGERRIAPAYDLPSTAPYGDRTMALSIGSAVEGVSRRRFLEFAVKAGMRERAVNRTIDDLLDATAGLVDSIRGGALAFNQQTTAELVAVLRNRRRLFEG